VTEELVVVGSDAQPMGYLYAFDRGTGEARWKLPFPGGVAAELHRQGDTILAVAVAGEVWAVELATGYPVWTYTDVPETDRRSHPGDPALAEGRLFVPWRPGAVDALDAATGERLWRRDLGATLNTSAAVVGGELVVGALDGRLYRLSPETGEILGSYDTGGAPYGDLVEAGGCLLALWAEGGFDESMAAAGPHVLACLEPGLGRVRWRHATESEWSTFRPLVWKGRVIAGGRDVLLALNLANGDLLWELPIAGVPRGLGAAEEALYVGTLSGKVFALPWDNDG
jgi:outer membrane protein assembly factor BamB